MRAAGGGPHELVRLKRRTGAGLGRFERPEWRDASAGEELVSHGGHLALSAAAGAAYGAAKPEGASPLVAGAVFGAGFYALAYGLAGPVLGVSPKLWKDSKASVARHGMLHLVFGVATALVAERVAKRI